MFAQRENSFFGFRFVNEKGISTMPDKIRALECWPTPRDVQQVRRFLGFAEFYQRFENKKRLRELALALSDLLTKDKRFE